MPPVVQSLDHPIYNSEGRESIFNWSLNVFLSFLVLISPSSKLTRSEEVLPMPSHKGMREHWVQLGAHNCLEHIHYTPFSILGFVSHALLVAKTTQRCLVQRTPCGTRFNEISAHPSICCKPLNTRLKAHLCTLLTSVQRMKRGWYFCSHKPRRSLV